MAKPLYPPVMSERLTIAVVKKYRRSISRFGDGELRLCYGGNCVSQKPMKDLGYRLREILLDKDEADNCVVCIPNINPITKVPEGTREFHRKYLDKKWTNLYRFDYAYGSTFITRPDNAYELDEEYFKEVQSLWEGRDVVLVNGDEPKAKFDKHPDIMKNARSVFKVEVPARDAWVFYPEILQACKAFHPTEKKLFILAIGPTATVLAYDLSQLGYQALDMGHFGRFYAGIVPEEAK